MSYLVKPYRARGEIAVNVPASKSALNRALLLAAFTEGDTLLRCGGYAEDTRALLGCLSALGIRTETSGEGILVHGSEKIARSASLDVKSAGTAARFLTAILAFRGGEYEMNASAQMESRPMELIPALEEAGARFVFRKEKGHFPFLMRSAGIRAAEMTVNTDESTQYASGILLAAALGSSPFLLRLTGTRTDGSYIAATGKLIADFGGRCERRGAEIAVTPITGAPKEYRVEPDVSGACYFFALSLLFGAKVTVRGLTSSCTQPDMRFLGLLKERGVRFTETPEGLCAEGSGAPFEGFTVNMRDFSDQALTVAALAPFASSPTVITGIGHTRKQECDRVHAIAENLSALGVPCEEFADGVKILPACPKGGTARTFGDHRVAMAFSLIGLRTGTVSLDDPACCKKTFENYFTLLEEAVN